MEGDAYLREAKILFASGQPEQSIRYFSLALEHGSDPLIVGLSRGTAWMARGMTGRPSRTLPWPLNMNQRMKGPIISGV